MKILGLIIGLFFPLCLFTCFSDFAANGFNKEIRQTKNTIAYVCSPYSHQMAKIRNREIYLLNTRTKLPLRLTDNNYNEGSLAWSPNGEELLFTSTRSTRRIAQFSDAEDPYYLCLYNFQSCKEKILEDNISLEVDKIYKKLINNGKAVKKIAKKTFNTYTPFWIKNDLIGFKRQLPFGLGVGPGDICTTDTSGKNLTIYRDLLEFPNWQIFSPQWISEDSIVCSIIDFNRDLKSIKKIALYHTKEMRFEILVDRKDRNAFNPSISNDRKNILFLETVPHSNDFKKDLLLLNIRTRKIKHILRDVEEAVFSPQNTKIAFIRKINSNYDVYIMNSDSTDVVRMTFDGGMKSSLAWSPNSDD